MSTTYTDAEIDAWEDDYDAAPASTWDPYACMDNDAAWRLIDCVRDAAAIVLPVEFTLDVEDAFGILSFDAEAAAEITAQYRSEVSAFGDAGPGQAIDAASASARVRRGDAWIAAVLAAFPVAGPAAPVVELDEEPF
jgi:hypothetical protein